MIVVEDMAIKIHYFIKIHKGMFLNNSEEVIRQICESGQVSLN